MPLTKAGGFMRKLIYIVLLAIAGLAAFAAAPATTDDGPKYAADGKLLRPTNYREWVYLSSGLGMNYAPRAAGHPMFTNVFVNPTSYRYFRQNGTWPDKTIFALEMYIPASHGSINKSGHYQSSFMGLEAEVKDESKGDNTWSYYGLGYDDASASAFPKDDCASCHSKNGAVEHSFVQFYPQLLDVAISKGTVKSSAEIPLSTERLYKKILAQGWERTLPEVNAAAAKDSEAEVAQEQNLNMLGYALMDNHANDAVGIFRFVAEKFPNSVNAYDSLADGLEHAGNKSEAVAAAQKEIQIADATADLSASDKERIHKMAEERIARLQAAK
jgi:hypothetical protein